MEEELVELAALYDLDPKRFFPKPKEDGTKAERLFFMAREKPKAGKAYYKEQLYGKDYKGTAYEVLRKKLIEDIYQSLGSVNFQNLYDGRTSKAVGLLRDEMLVLSSPGAVLGKWREKLAKRVVHKAAKLETWGIVQRVSRRLSSYYSYTIDRRSFSHYQAISVDARKKFHSEHLTSDIYNKWISKYSNKRGSQMRELNGLKADVQEVNRIYNSSKTIVNYTRCVGMETFFYEWIQDYEKCLSVIEKAFQDEYINHVDKLFVEGLEFKRLRSYANLREYERAEVGYQHLIKTTQPFSHNWFLGMDYLFILNLSMCRYERAFDVFDQVDLLQEQGRLNSLILGQWHLYSYYLGFLLASGIWQPEDKSVQAKLLTCEISNSKDAHHVIQDKLAGNLSLIVVKYLISLQESNYNAVIDDRDALSSYLHRHFKGEQNQRTKIFITFLIKVIDYDFNYYEVVKKTQKLREKMQGLSPNFNSNLGGNEIIDYEVLWDWVLEKIKEHSYTRPLN